MTTRCSLPAAMAVGLAVCLLIAAASPARANLVTDPSFESCIGIGQTPPPGWSGTATCAAVAHSGFWSANLLGVGPSPTQTLSQSIATTAGAMYDFSFWLFNNERSQPNSFTASFGPDVVLNLTNDTDTFPYKFEDFTVTAMAASTTISFTSSGLGSSWNLDDVSVTPVAAPVPEPATLSVLGGALGLLLFTARRRRRHWARVAGSALFVLRDSRFAASSG